MFDNDDYGRRRSGGFNLPISRRLIGLICLVLLALFLGPKVLETNRAGYEQVKQAAFTGTLTCRLEPGTYGQLFGDITTYPEAETFFFTADSETGEGRDQSLPTRFNDGAKAQVSGSLRVIWPRNCEDLVNLHRKFHSRHGVMEKLVLPAVRKALFNTGPHMSAGESYAERRGEFASLAEDQLSYGVIAVDKYQETRPDPITGEQKEVWVLTKRECADNTNPQCVNGFIRDRAAFAEFGVTVTNFVIDHIEYPNAVLDQIETQRSARMNVITQQAQAKEAEARAAKADAEAEAQIAETRAKEEVAKTEKIVRAEALREEARLAQEAAEFYKQEQILRGEGDAQRRRALIQADGALEQKLATYEAVNKLYAEAISSYGGNWVPTFVMGGASSGQSPDGAQQLIGLLTAKTAQDLSLDLSVPEGSN